MRFDAVIFDLYGTLVDSVDAPGPKLSAYVRTAETIAPALGAPPEPFVELWNSTFADRMTGAHPSLEAYVAALCRALDVVPRPEQLAEAVRIRLDMFRAQLVPRHDAVETLRNLRAMGHRIGLITDCSWETPQLWPDTALPPYFDSTVFSCAVGMRKPDPRIYAIACDQLGVAPERCLYVGDGNSNELAGAERVGMTALCIHVPYETPPDHANPWPGPEVSALAQVLDHVKE